MCTMLQVHAYRHANASAQAPAEPMYSPAGHETQDVDDVQPGDVKRAEKGCVLQLMLSVSPYNAEKPSLLTMSTCLWRLHNMIMTLPKHPCMRFAPVVAVYVPKGHAVHEVAPVWRCVERG